MLTVSRINDFVLHQQDTATNNDYIYKITIRGDEGHFNNKYVTFKLNHVNGMFDTTVTSDEYDCYLIHEEDLGKAVMDTMSPKIGFFVRRDELKTTDLDYKEEPTKHAVQALHTPLSSSKRGIINNEGDAKITLCDNNNIDMKAEGVRLFLDGKNGNIGIVGNIVDYNTPSSSSGGIFKEKGILSFFPQGFVPPFCLPNRLPDPNLFMRVANIIKAGNAIMNAV